MWGVGTILLALSGGRVAFGAYVDLDYEGLLDRERVSTTLGGSITSYPVADIDLAIRFSFGSRSGAVSGKGQNDSERKNFSGVIGKIGIGYLPDTNRSGFYAIYEREAIWNRKSDIFDEKLTGNVKLLPHTQYSRTFSVGWSHAF